MDPDADPTTWNRARRRGVILFRKQFLELWQREHYPHSEIWAIYQDDYQSQHAEWLKTRAKFNVSLTRSIVSLRGKGLVRTFKLYRPDVDLWMFGNILRVAKFTGPLIRDEKQRAEEDRITGIYEAAKEAKKKGYVQLHEVKADDQHVSSVQVVGLTAKGKEVALNANITEDQKISNKEELSSSQVSSLQTASPVTDTTQPITCMQEVSQ